MNGRVNLTAGLAADFHQSNAAYLQIPTCWSHRGGFEVQFYFLMSFLGQSPTFRGSRQCLKGNGEPKTSLFVYTQPKRRAVSAFVVIYLYSRIQH